MTKTLNQIICFFLHQNQNIFLSNIGNQNIFLEENHNPFQVKWSVPNKSFKGKVSQNVNLQQLKFEIF
jgi:ribonucleotide reductase beta subunit family protein with ferritin-like domain